MHSLQAALLTFSERLQALMKQQHLSQKDLADSLHLTPGALNRYLRGNRMPGIELLLQLADYFQVSVSYLLGETDEPGLPVLLTPDETQLLETYRHLPQNLRDNFRTNHMFFLQFANLCNARFSTKKRDPDKN